MMFRVRCISFILAVFLSQTASAELARAVISNTGPVPVKGSVFLLDTPKGMRMVVQITQGPPGAHALHIYENGLCSADESIMGWHYNPKRTIHGNIFRDGLEKAHVGDFGDITIGPDGQGSLRAVIPGVTISHSPLSVAGRSIVLHERSDSYLQPLGNAGQPIGCGAIAITEQ